VPFVKLLEELLEPIPVGDGQEDDDTAAPLSRKKRYTDGSSGTFPEREQHGPRRRPVVAMVRTPAW